MRRPWIPLPRLGALIWVHENATDRMQLIVGMMRRCIKARLVALNFWRAKIKWARKAYEYNDGMHSLKDASVNAIDELLGEK